MRILGTEEATQSLVKVHNLLAGFVPSRLSSPRPGVAAGGRQPATGLLLPANGPGSSPGQAEHPGGSHFVKTSIRGRGAASCLCRKGKSTGKQERESREEITISAEAEGSSETRLNRRETSATLRNTTRRT